MTELAEIKGLVEAINPALVALRKEVDEIKSRDREDVVTQAKWDAMLQGKDGKAGILTQMQELQDKQAKHAAEVQKLEAALRRPGGTEGADPEAAERKAAYADYMRKGILANRSADSQPIQIKAMSTEVGPDGGYLVMPELSATVVSRIFETSPVRQVANQEQTESTSKLVLIDDDEAGARWVSEGASGGETDTAQVGRKEIAVHKIEADPRETIETIRSAYFDVEAWHARKVAERFGRIENTAFVQGTGVGQPRGFMTYAAWTSAGVYERNKIEQIVTGSGAAITSDGLISLQMSLKEAYQPGAVFAMHRTTFGSVLKLKGADNYYVSPVIMRDGVATMQLLGKPVIFMSDIDLEGSNALCAVYGDFSRGYTIVDGMGLTVLRDPYTNKGFVTFYTTRQTGGDVTNFDALKIHKCASS